MLLFHICGYCCQVSHVSNGLFEVLRFRDNLQGLPNIEPLLKGINTTRITLSLNVKGCRSSVLSSLICLGIMQSERCNSSES